MHPSTETSPAFQKRKHISCFCNRKSGSQHDIPPGIMSVFFPASLSCDFVIQLQCHVTDIGNHQSNPKTIGFPQSLTLSLKTAYVMWVWSFAQSDCRAQPSKPKRHFYAPTCDALPTSPLWGKAKTHSAAVACQCCQYHVSGLEVKCRTLWTLFLK